MKQYQEVKSEDTLIVIGYSIENKFIPPDSSNLDFQQMNAEVDAGEAEILPYVPPSDAEIATRDIAQRTALKMAPDRLSAALAVIGKAVDLSNLLDDDIRNLAAIYPDWRNVTAYAVDDVVNYNDELYQVIQAHTSQSDWTPPVVPALFRRYTQPGTVAPWVQPTGAHDAYAKGVKVSHEGQTWQSTADANVWPPGVYGWAVVGEPTA